MKSKYRFLASSKGSILRVGAPGAGEKVILTLARQKANSVRLAADIVDSKEKKLCASDQNEAYGIAAPA